MVFGILIVIFMYFNENMVFGAAILAAILDLKYANDLIMVKLYLL